jgi:phosphoribosylanthranilate isomerase
MEKTKSTSNKSLKIKICGMQNRQNIEALIQLPIDYIGFIFYPQSPRYVGKALDAETIRRIPSHIKKTGIFVNATLNEVLRVASDNSLDCIQLHGNEIPDYCIALKEKGYEVIKAFKAEPEQLTCETSAYRYACDYFLFDTPTLTHGGSGQKFDWKILGQQKLSLPFFLSGGIGPGDADAIKSLEFQGLYGIDLNSKFEIEPGLKNIEQIKIFLKEISK